MVTITQIEIVGIRLARVSLIKDGVEAFRLRHIQRAQDEGIEDAEDHCVGADGQSEREHCRKGKPGRAAQLAEGIAEIEPEAFKSQSQVDRGNVFPGGGGVAEAHQRVAAGFGGRHAGGEVVVNAHVDVGLQFEVYLAVDPRPREKIGNAANNGHGITSCVLQHGANALHQLVKVLFGFLQLLSTGSGQLVIFCFSIGLRQRPLGADPSALFHAVKSRVERTFFNTKQLVRSSLDVEDNPISMQFPPLSKGFEH